MKEIKIHCLLNAVTILVAMVVVRISLFNISLRVQIKSISQLDATSMGFSLCGEILRHIFARVNGKLSCASNFATIFIAFN